MMHSVPIVTNPKTDPPPHPGEDQSSKRVKLDETPDMEEDPMMDAPVETRSSPEGEVHVSVGGSSQDVPETQMTVDPSPNQEVHMNVDIETSAGIKAPSFKEKLLNSLSESPEEEEEDITIKQGDVSIGLNGNIPTVDFASHIIDTLNKKMGLAVVIKLLGRKIGFRPLRNQLQNLWKPTSQIKIIDLHDDCFLVKFQDDLDYQNALLSGPWVIFGHYLSVQPWTPSFKPQNYVINQVMGWIRLPKLPARYYHKSVIRSIGSVFGEVIKVDYNTDSGDRARFARIAVNIDLTKPLTSKILVDGELIFVEYEGLPSICFNCGRYGHLQQACPLIQAQAASSAGPPEIQPVPEPVGVLNEPEARVDAQYRAWMQVQRRRRTNVRKERETMPHASKKGASVSRYEVLRDLPVEEQLPVQEISKEDRLPTASSLVQRKKGTLEKSKSKQKMTSDSQGINQDCLFNSNHYVALKSTSSLDQNYNAAIQVFDPRIPNKSQETPRHSAGPSSQILNNPRPNQGMDPLSTSRGIKIASGVTIHNLGAKPNPDSARPSIRFMKQLARDIQSDIGASDVAVQTSYFSPQLQFRKFLWHDLDHLASNISSPWLLAGDFNAILHQDERRGGSVHRARGCSFFNKFLHSNGLVDLEFSGPRFTWRRGSLLMRLDRAVCNSFWLQLFPNSSVDHLPKIMSDHRPIMIKLGLCHLSGPVDPPFKFLAAWLSHSDFSSIVHRIWQSGDDLMACIDSFKSEIQKWNVETFGHIGRRKRRLFRRLNGIQTKLENSPDASSTFLSDLETSLREEMEEVCFQEELLWLQKSSSDWLCLGDRNTNYYHMKALIRKKRNFISQLKSSDGSWITEEDQLSHLACNYFSDLYSLDVPSFIPLSLNGAFPSLSDHALMRLNIPIVPWLITLRRLSEPDNRWISNQAL
ncbi:hypothetical protein K1719_040970 [Acacia pycnantha]|nr:hypothetical protein K1719_040970 [Acacia pycnantha]